jgi:GNAT superfamily N-acetyltransferase
MPKEAETVANILKGAAQWLEQKDMPLWREEELAPARIATDVSAGLRFLAETNGESAGTLRFQLDDSLVWPNAPPLEAAYIHELAVRRRYAGTGLSTRLLRWGVERTRALNRQYLRLDCVASRLRLRVIYETFGFRYHGDQHFDHALDAVARYEYDVRIARGGIHQPFSLTRLLK